MHGPEAGPGRAVVGIELNRVLEHLGASGQIGLRHAGQVLPSAQVEFVGRHAGRRTWPRRSFAQALDVSPQRRRDALGNLVLDGEDVVEHAVETLRPAVIAGGDLDELDGDAQASVCLANAAFEQRGHAELPADGLNIGVATGYHRWSQAAQRIVVENCKAEKGRK